MNCKNFANSIPYSSGILTIDNSFNPKLRDYGRPTGFDVFHADIRDILKMPLVHHPGENWEYGIGIDWAGIVLERASGVKLNDWIQKNIMQPLNLDAINMFPTDDMKKNLAYMHQRWPGSQASEERDHMYREPIIAETDEQKKNVFHSGGAGCFAKPVQYVQVLSVLLNDGKSPITGAQILKKETVDEMFRVRYTASPSLIGVSLTSYTEPSRTVPRLRSSRHSSCQTRADKSRS